VNAIRFAIAVILPLLVQAAITYVAAYFAVKRALRRQRPASAGHP